MSSDAADNVPSKYRKTPSLRRHAFFWRITTAGITFFRSSGFPFLTVANTMSPTDAEGRRLRTPLMPLTEMMYRFLAPVLSAQLITAPTGRERVVRNLLPEAPPRPTQSDQMHVTANKKQEGNKFQHEENHIVRIYRYVADKAAGNRRYRQTRSPADSPRPGRPR